MLGRRNYLTGILAILLSGLGGCSREPAAGTDSGPMLVVASILPLADFLREVGGNSVRVEVMVPPAASPHTYEPTPGQLMALGQARLLVLNGIGLEYWAEEVISAADNPDLAIVNLGEGERILEGGGDEHEGHGHGQAGNPHIWLSPRNAMGQVERIRDALIRADPDGAGRYRANAARYLEELGSLDEEFREAVSQFSNRRFIAFHAAWAYLARDYGLEQAAVVERSPGHEPSPAEIAAIIQTARSIGAKAIFAEPQFSSKAAEAIAEESGAQVLFLDPLGFPPDYRYLDLMRYNLAEISKALR